MILQDRSLSPRRPGPYSLRPPAQSTLVDKDYGFPLARRISLEPSQRLLFPAARWPAHLAPVLVRLASVSTPAAAGCGRHDPDGIAPRISPGSAGHSAQGPHPIHVPQRLGPALEHAFHPPQIHSAQTWITSCPPRFLQTGLPQLTVWPNGSPTGVERRLAGRLPLGSAPCGAVRVASRRHCSSASKSRLTPRGFPMPPQYHKIRQKSLCYTILNKQVSLFPLPDASQPVCA
jgi:hypothetical protein